MEQKVYYHILEYGSYGNIGHQGYYDTIKEADDSVKRLKSFFPNLDFQIFASDSQNEPPIVTI